MALHAQDFKEVARKPALVGLGAALQYTIMPLMGFLVSRLANLPSAAAVGWASRAHTHLHVIWDTLTASTTQALKWPPGSLYTMLNASTCPDQLNTHTQGHCALCEAAHLACTLGPHAVPVAVHDLFYGMLYIWP